MFRAKVGSESTTPILVVDNAIPMLKIRRAAASFAVLNVPSVCAVLRERLQSGGRCWRFARARAEGRLSPLAQSVSWIGHVHETWIGCVITFSERGRAKSVRECVLAIPSGSGS